MCLSNEKERVYLGHFDKVHARLGVLKKAIFGRERENISTFRYTYGVLREAYQVARPSMGLVASSLYLYRNPNPSILMASYSAFIMQMLANAGNDWMDWERDQAEHGREFSVSRGKARSKDYAWYYYMFAVLVTLIISVFDPFFGLQYVVIGEFAGSYLYNGVLFGVAMNELSFVKSVGFPLDFFVACWTYMPFSHLFGQRRWFPSLTISAWGTTMLWAQLKDYEHEKNTNVKTTATTLGANNCRIIISVAATIMMYCDWQFFVYGIYTYYSCWYSVLTGKEKKGKMSVMMALNLVLITVFDKNVDAKVKWTCYLSQTFAFMLYQLSFVVEQKFYAVQGVINRHKPYDPKVWNEEDPDILLWKVGSMIGRSASGIIGLFGPEMSRGCLMGYIVFRTQDTWADVAIGSGSRIRGLSLLPKRYNKLEESDKLIGEDDVDDVKWDFKSRERNRLYVHVTKNVHRFDIIYKRMKPSHRQILREYAEDLSEGWIELEQRKDEPVSPEIMRKHAEVAIDSGFFGMCKAMSPSLLKAIRTNEFEPKTRNAFVAFSDYVWYMNLAASIEEDVKEGVALHEELQAMNGLDEKVVQRVRLQWLIHANEEHLKSGNFFYHPALASNWCLRFFILHFAEASRITVEKYCCSMSSGISFKKTSGGSLLFKSFKSSLTKDGYIQAARKNHSSSHQLLQKLKDMQQL